MPSRSFQAPRWVPPVHELARALGADARAIARHLDIAERTVYHWQHTDTSPRAARLALWWETPAGRAAITEHEQRGQQLYRGLADALERENAGLRARIARLEALGQFGSANGPLWASR